ncbi:SulP family inorganic anion transporter [Agrobacterium sp. NPDC089420]|uniref:SulP family inorganic anion transporter n=1 Tax=Agrobacterium sp. NPDC089420 TaxID=3363918 RepID=UPI00384CA731
MSVTLNRRDVIAGLSIAGLMLPEAIAYSGIAGVPAQHAILAAVMGCIVYAVFGQSRFAVVSPTSSSAAILAAMLATLSVTPAQKILLVAISVALVGLLFVLAAAMRLGALSSVISRPVLRGFAFGLAILITIKQLPSLFGVREASGEPLAILLQVLSHPRDWSLASIAVGLTALAVLLVLRRRPAIPGSLVVILAGICASILLDLQSRGVAIVGPIDLAGIWAGPFSLSLDDVAHVARFAPPLVLILFAESWGTIRSFSLRHGENVDSNRELRAFGLANIASAAVQGMPVGAGFSAGAASEAVGPQSRFASAIAAIGLAVFSLLASGWFAFIPQAVLAAVIAVALLHALDPTPIIRLWRLGNDAWLALAAAASVLAFGVLNGMLVAVALSFAVFVRRLSLPHVMHLGRLGDSHDFVDMERHPDAKDVSGMIILRPAQPLFFGNAEPILAAVSKRIAARPELHVAIISLEESFELDSTALDALLEFDAAMRRGGTTVYYARMHDHVRDLLLAGGGDNLVARSSFSVDDAVTTAMGRENSHATVS